MSEKDNLLDMRLKKVADLRSQGLNPYRIAEKPRDLAAALHSRFGGLEKEPLEALRAVPQPEKFSVAGRMLLYLESKFHSACR